MALFLKSSTFLRSNHHFAFFAAPAASFANLKHNHSRFLTLHDRQHFCCCPSSSSVTWSISQASCSVSVVGRGAVSDDRTAVIVAMAPSTRDRKRSGANASTQKAKKVKASSSSSRGGKKDTDTTTQTPVADSSASASGRKYYLMKSEPESRIQNGQEMKFSIDDLVKEPESTTHWDGVRNHEAKNIMCEMRIGDRAFFYHSNCKKTPPGIVGEVEITREAYPDHTAFDPKDVHYDPKSSADKPRWFMVDVRFARKFKRPVTLPEIRECAALQDMMLVKRGRISVNRVTEDEWHTILDMAGEEPLGDDSRKEDGEKEKKKGEIYDAVDDGKEDSTQDSDDDQGDEDEQDGEQKR